MVKSKLPFFLPFNFDFDFEFLVVSTNAFCSSVRDPEATGGGVKLTSRLGEGRSTGLLGSGLDSLSSCFGSGARCLDAVGSDRGRRSFAGA